MPKVFINGLRENCTRILLADLSKLKGEQGRELINKIANDKGVVEGKIDKSFIGKKVKLVIRDAPFIYDDDGIIEVDKLGVFHTAKLKKESNFNGNIDDPPSYNAWDSTGRFREGQREARQLYRSIRRINEMAIVVSLILLIFGPVVGLVFGSIEGVLASIAVGGFGYYITPIALGID